MYNIQIDIGIPTKFFALFDSPLESIEASIEDIVGRALLEVFESVAVSDVSINYQNTDVSDVVVDINVPDNSYSESNERNIEETELFIEKLISSALSGSFENVYIYGVTIKHDIPATLTIRIQEEPLTAQNLTTIVSALNALNTKCQLIYKGRFGELIDYIQTHDNSFIEEPRLYIVTMSKNSPAELKLDFGVKDVAEAIKIAVDAITQAPLRYEEAKLNNQKQSSAIKLNEEETLSELLDKEQNRQIEAQNAELERKRKQLELEEQQLQLETRRLEIQEKRLEVEKKRIDYALETATKVVTIVNPNVDQPTKEILLRTLLPHLLQLGNSIGLEIALPAQDDSEKKET